MQHHLLKTKTKNRWGDFNPAPRRPRPPAGPRRRRHWNSRQREKLSILAAETAHQLQHFRKFRVFKISVSWTTVAWHGITFSIRNAQSWYFGKIKFKHIVTTWVRGFPGIHLFQHRKTGLQVANVLVPWPDFVEQSPLLMQLLFGVTTLRVMWMKSAPPQSIEIRASEKIWAY